MKRNQVLEQVTIEAIAAEGKALARVNDKVVFVKGVAPGDVVDIRIIRKKKSFMEGIAIHFHEYSKDRVDPFCEHFGTCGGCKWQHIPYSLQLAFKQQQVEDNMQRIGKITTAKTETIVASDQTQYYRNKLEFTFSNSRWLTREEIDSGVDMQQNVLGFHIPGRFDKILNIDHCYLQANPSNEIRNKLYDYAAENNLSFYDLRKNEGFLRTITIRSSSVGEVMVILQVAQDNPEDLQNIMQFLAVSFPQITSLNYVINLKLNDTIQDQQVINYGGNPYINEEMPLGDGSEQKLTFRIGPKSFYQTNSLQAYHLYAQARTLAQINKDDIVYDLYTGIGTIANFIAHEAKKVIGLEYVEDAIKDAQVNAEINNIDNTAFFAGDIKDLLNDEFVNSHGRPDVIITDPPRAGMHADVVKMLNILKAPRIVYISCNPATQARDLALLEESYTVKRLQPVDMFPQTHHVENIALLELN